MVRPRTGFDQAEYYRGWYKRNKKKMLAYMRRYRAEHPEYVERENARNRKKYREAKK
jgi:hypothetical protein